MSPDQLRSLQDAIVRLLKQRPFYGQFLLQFRRLPYSGNKAVSATIADAIPTLRLNQEYFDLFDEREQEALLEHVVKHILHLHPCRRKERQTRLWDLACDLAINPGIKNLPPEAIRPARLKLPDGLAAEEYYQRLLLMPELGNLFGEGRGGQNQSEKSGPEQQQNIATQRRANDNIDDHTDWQESDRTPLTLSQQVVRQMVKSAWQKSFTEESGELEQLLQPFLRPPQIPWQQILRQFVATAGRIGRSSTWSRTHRRFGQLTPGVRKQQYLSLVIAVDVSDSTDSQELRERFAVEVMRIAQSRHCRMTILYTGSRIQKISEFSGHPQIMEIFRGGGFTDLRPAFDYAKRMHPRPAAMIYLTDGYGPAPEYQEIPTLWVLSPEGKNPAPWGQELRLADIATG